MAVEIERKFLATHAVLEHCRFGLSIVQGYLYTDAENTVRVRRAGDRTFFAWKGPRCGARREEIEHEISSETGAAMFAALRPDRCLAKTRYRVEHAGAVWEVDVFGGDLSGLILAEIELAHEDEAVILPPWAGPEVTTDERYRNSRLALRAGSPILLAA